MGWKINRYKMKTVNFKNRTLRLKTSYRGGGIEIHLDGLKNNKYRGEKMTAYQNYLGGGMLGAIANDCTLPTNVWTSDKYLVALAEQLARYFHGLTNHEDDEWESATFEENQKRMLSAY